MLSKYYKNLLHWHICLPINESEIKVDLMKTNLLCNLILKTELNAYVLNCFGLLFKKQQTFFTGSDLVVLGVVL